MFNGRLKHEKPTSVPLFSKFYGIFRWLIQLLLTTHSFLNCYSYIILSTLIHIYELCGFVCFKCVKCILSGESSLCVAYYAFIPHYNKGRCQLSFNTAPRCFKFHGYIVLEYLLAFLPDYYPFRICKYPFSCVYIVKLFSMGCKLKAKWIKFNNELVIL